MSQILLWRYDLLRYHLYHRLHHLRMAIQQEVGVDEAEDLAEVVEEEGHKPW
jgi:hypothetical protein